MSNFSENKFGLSGLPDLGQFAKPQDEVQDERAEAAAAAAEYAAVAGKTPLRVNAAGDVEPTAPGYIDPGPAWYQLRADLDPHDLLRFHAFALCADAHPEEVEALAVSLWEDAGWAAPNLLRLHDNAYAAGPFSLPRKVGQAAGFSASRTQVYLIDCPETRVAVDANAPILGTPDAFTRAFPDAEPVGLEAEICHGLLRVARRLGGEIRFVPSGMCVVPDPDSAITMTLYSPRLLAPETVREVAEKQLVKVQLETGTEIAVPDSFSEVPAGFVHPLPNRMNQDFRGLRAAAIADASGEERAQLHAAADAFDAHQLLSESDRGSGSGGYMLYGELPGGQAIQISVEESLTLPTALRWESWAADTVYAYTISWLDQAYESEARNLTRKLRIQRLQVADAIERCAADLEAIAAGAVLDEDGFLVDLRNTM